MIEEIIDPAKEFFDKVKGLSKDEANQLVSSTEECIIMASELNSENWFITWAWHGYWSIGPGAHDF